MTAEDLQRILEGHQAWLKGEDTGVRARLTYARLSNVNLSRANLSGARLTHANLSRANLSRANLSGASLSGVDLTGARLSGVHLAHAIPIVPDLDAKIWQAIQAEGALDMVDWHTCQTTHCRGGWAVHLAGTQGAELERHMGSSAAAALIYWASTGYVPNFYADTDVAFADIQERVGAQP